VENGLDGLGADGELKARLRLTLMQFFLLKFEHALIVLFLGSTCWVVSRHMLVEEVVSLVLVISNELF
jgi:hypothetical protein